MTPKRALTIALLLSFAVLMVEVTGGIAFRSSALVADALHIVTDILAISFSFVALSISARPPSENLTYGYHRIEVLATLVNGISLLGVVAGIVYQAFLRLLTPEPLFVSGTIALGALALGLNLVSSRILAGVHDTAHGHEDLNISSAGAHVFGDALASLVVIVGAAAVYLTGQPMLDPLAAILIGMIVLRSAISITRESGAIILDRSPIKNMRTVQEVLHRTPGVSDIHDLHIWRVCSHITVASLHACLDPSGLQRQLEVRKELERELFRFGAQHVTIQFEESCCLPTHDHFPLGNR